MIDALKSIAIVSLVLLNAILIVTGCNVIGTNAFAAQMEEKEQIVRERNAKFESIVTASDPH
jgi:hypothetical protein